MGTQAVTFLQPDRNAGENNTQGRYVPAFPLIMLAAASLGAGVTVGPIYETSGAHTLRLICAVTAKSGTSPTLDVTVQTSEDGLNNWRTVGTFAQKTDAAAAPNASAYDGLKMGAVGATGTSPPTITLTGTQLQPVNLKVVCTTSGALGTWAGYYSVDGGTTRVNFTSAATVSVIDPNGTDTGLVLNIAAGSASTDNVWTASTVGFEMKDFTGLDRFTRVVGLVGGSATPTMTAYVKGRIVQTN